VAEESVVGLGLALSPLIPEDVILESNDHAAADEALSARLYAKNGHGRRRRHVDTIAERGEHSAISIPRFSRAPRRSRELRRIDHGRWLSREWGRTQRVVLAKKAVGGRGRVELKEITVHETMRGTGRYLVPVAVPRLDANGCTAR